MMLAHPSWSKPIEFHENQVEVLTIENEIAFRNTVIELTSQAQGLSGAYVLSHEGTTLKPTESLHIIHDYVHLEPQDKKITTSILNGIQRAADDALQEETFAMKQAIHAFLQAVEAENEFSITHDEDHYWQGFLKAMGFQVNFDVLNPAEALVEHVLLYRRFFKNLCVILIHARCWFSDEEMEAIEKELVGYKVPVLMIEHTKRKRVLPLENYRVIDRDLCELNF